uniref:Ig-like domain-containing protein n=1 Tax=Anas platyrhynchos TaxID=8839 RepID=A0A8B9TB84_ANAPL
MLCPGSRAPQQPQTLLSLSPGADAQAVQGFQLHQPQKEVSVMAGETLTLICTVTGGGPLGPVKWLKGWGSGSETIYDQKGSSSRVTRAVNESNTDFTILIRDVRPEDAGTYYCVKFRKTASDDVELYQRGEGTERRRRAVVRAPSPPSPPSPPSVRLGPCGATRAEPLLLSGVLHHHPCCLVLLPPQHPARPRPLATP